jgi:hypothetical protein
VVRKYLKRMNQFFENAVKSGLRCGVCAVVFMILDDPPCGFPCTPLIQNPLIQCPPHPGPPAVVRASVIVIDPSFDGLFLNNNG